MKKYKQIIYDQNVSQRPAFFLIIIILISFFTFISVLNNSFIEFMDDGVQVINNAEITNLSFFSIKKIFTSYYAGMYQPFTTLTYLSDYLIYGLSPKGFHFTNLFFHLFAVFTLYIFLLKIIKEPLLVFFLSLIFAVHPTCVESVAWISARSNILYSIFYLSGLISYYIYLHKKEKTKYYYLTLTLFILSCLSKSAAVTFPFVLIALDIFYSQLTFKKIIEKIPFFIISLIFGLITLDSRTKAFQFTDLSVYYNTVEQILLVLYSIFMYIRIFLFPYNNSAYYPYPENITGVIIFLSVIAVITILFLRYLYKKNRKAFFGLLFFIFSISIMLKFVSNSFQIIADRYLYLPMTGLIITLGFIIVPFFKKNILVFSFLFMIIIASFCLRTVSYNKIWNNEETLIFNIVKTQPDAAPFKNRIGTLYRKKGDYKNALKLFNEIIKKYPTYGNAYNNRGNLYKDMGEFKNALKDYQTALLYNEKNPISEAEIYTNIGILYAMSNDFKTAFHFFSLAIDKDPDCFLSYLNRGKAFASVGNYNFALEDINKSISLNPNCAMAYYTRGMIYYTLGNKDESCKDLRNAYKLGAKINLIQFNNICN